MPAIDKVIRGALKYRQSGAKDALRDQMARSKTSPQPNALFFTCMDSRLMPTKFTQTHDGSTLFLIRNAGNMVPAQCCDNVTVATEPGALELACVHSGVHHVVVCGHSDCKAMDALHSKHLATHSEAQLALKSPLNASLKHFGQLSLDRLNQYQKSPATPLTFIKDIEQQTFTALIDQEKTLLPIDRLSQIHCLQQLENISSHSVLRPLLTSGLLQLHAMWFCVSTGEVFYFDKSQQQFVILDEENVERLLSD